MKKLMNIIAAGAMALTFLFILPGISAAGGYLKMGDIKGESTDAGHKDWIVIESVTMDTSRPQSATGGRHHEPITVTKSIDKASPKLQEASTSGKMFPKVVIEYEESGDGRTTYLKYELKNVMITSYSMGGGAAGDVPMEEFSLNYKEIKVTYTKDKDTSKDKPRRKDRDR